MILVDSIRIYDTPLRYKGWSHMVSDTSEEELHAFAARLGLKRSWFQSRPKASAAHYDLTPTKRALAVKLGAVEVTSKELVMRNYEDREARDVPRGETMKTSPCYYVLADLWTERAPSGGVKTIDAMRLSLPTGATAESIVATMIASVGVRLEMMNLATSLGPREVALKATVMGVGASCLYISTLIDCADEQRQAEIQETAVKISNERPGLPPGRVLLRALISSSLRWTHDEYPDMPMEAFETVDRSLAAGARGIVYAALIKGTLPQEGASE